MTKQSRIDKIIKLTQCGWRAYEGQATGQVYDNLDCGVSNRGRARWFARGDLLVCIGCERSCTLPCPDGFQLPLFKYPAPPTPAFRLPPEQLLAKRLFLSTNEVSYILNISPRQVRTLIYMGRLRATKDLPRRIPAEEVRAMIAGMDWWTPESELALDEKAKALP